MTNFNNEARLNIEPAKHEIDRVMCNLGQLDSNAEPLTISQLLMKQKESIRNYTSQFCLPTIENEVSDLQAPFTPL